MYKVYINNMLLIINVGIFFCFVEQSAQWKEKGFLVACKDKAKIQLIGWVTQKVNSIGMILCNTLRTMSILQKTEEGSVMP